MGSKQSQDCDLPITTAVSNGGGDAPPSTPALHLTTNILFPSLGPLATLIIWFLSNKPLQDATLSSLLEVFAFSIFCVFGTLLASSSLPPTATALATLLRAATDLSAASALASLVSVLLRPHLRWAVYSSFMTCILALLVLRSSDWTKTLRRSLGVSRAQAWVSGRVDSIREWFHACTGIAPAST